MAIDEMRRQPCAVPQATLTCSPLPPAGNAFFKKKQHLKAAGCYTKAARKEARLAITAGSD